VVIVVRERIRRGGTLLIAYFRTGRDIWFSLSFDILDVFAGAISALVLLPYIHKTPWILAVLPIMLTIRGVGNGIFSGVLTTSLHIGTIEPRFRRNSSMYYSLVSSMLAMMLINIVLATLIIFMLSLDPIISMLSFFVMMIAMALSVTFSIITTSFVGFIAFNRGINPDDVVYPVMSTLNDVFISIFLLASIFIIEPWNMKHALSVGFSICIILTIPILYLCYIYRHDSTFRKTLKEGMIGVVYAVVLSSIGGRILSGLYDIFTRKPEYLILLPLLMTLTGDSISIIASRLTTALHLGSIEIEDVRGTTYFILNIQAITIIPYTSSLLLGSLIAVALTTNLALSILLSIFINLITIGLISTIILLPITILVSYEAFRRGLNPDNFTIPIVTSTADFLSILLCFMTLTASIGWRI